MEESIQEGNTSIFLLFTLFLLIFVLVLFMSGSKNSQPVQKIPLKSQQAAITLEPKSENIITTDKQTTEFKSKNLDFIITLLTNYKITEKNTFVDLSSQQGLINIVRNATNFNSLSEYIEAADKRKYLTLNSTQTIKISTTEALRRVEVNNKSKDKQLAYYVYIDNWVYILSTSSEELYDDLDQIAKSFKYIPD